MLGPCACSLFHQGSRRVGFWDRGDRLGDVQAQMLRATGAYAVHTVLKAIQAKQLVIDEAQVRRALERAVDSVRCYFLRMQLLQTNASCLGAAFRFASRDGSSRAGDMPSLAGGADIPCSCFK